MGEYAHSECNTILSKEQWYKLDHGEGATVICPNCRIAVHANVRDLNRAQRVLLKSQGVLGV